MHRTLAVSTLLSPGDIVGRAFRMFRQNILMIGKNLLLPTIFMCLGRIAMVIGISFGSKYLDHWTTGIAWYLLAAGGITLFIGGYVFMWLRALAIVRFLTGFSSDYNEAKKFVNSSFWALFALGIATSVAIGTTALLWTVVVVLCFPLLKAQGLQPVIGSLGVATGILGLLCTIIFISMVSNLVGVALALEKRDLGGLIGEGVSLTMRAYLRSVLFLIVTLTATTLVAYPMTLPMIILMGGYMVFQGAITGSPAGELPVYIQVLNSVWETTINMIISPIYYLAYGLFYSDLRMRQEGLDILERLDDVETEDGSGRLSSHGI